VIREVGVEHGEFVSWLSGIGKLSLLQRRQALEALSEAAGTAEGVGSGSSGLAEMKVQEPGASRARVARDKAGSEPRVRADALGEISHGKVERMGCPHCAERDIVAWGRANGLARYRCKSCRRTFNALTKTPMARLRKKEQWPDHAQAMLEGMSLAKVAERCGVHPTTAFRWRHRFLGSAALDKPKTLTGIVEADETFILESFKGRRSDLPRQPRKRGGKAKHPGLFFENIPILVARDREGATVDAVLPNVDSASIAAVLGGLVTPANRFVCDGGKAIVAFARRANIPVHVVPAPGKPIPEAPDIHINNVNAYHSRLKEWMRRFHGVATKNLPNYLGWRRALEAWGDQANPQNWILGAIGMGPYQQQTL
jgi:transposase-like protein